MNTFESVINDVTLFHKVFDIIRIVDPIKKEVLYMKKNLQSDTRLSSASCYDFWSNGKVCDNCISMRAVAEQDVFVKLEHVQSSIYLTTAYPLEGQYKGYVVEIIKDISGSDIADTLPDENWGTLHGHIENKNIRFVTDQKTGLYNIRYLQEKLPYELINNAGKGYESAVLIVDIDGFKTINTTFGYDAGDAVLKRLAHLLTGCIREDYDWAVRLNGDTYMVYLKNISFENTKKICQKICSQVGQSSLSYESKTIHISVSIGAGHLKPQNTLSVDKILKIANKLLVQAKHNEQNQYYCKEVTE